MPPITLTTDFGIRDHYVGVMKGVILRIASDATIIDITHEIEPQNILNGAFTLRQALPWFPAGTIHVAVVDPGVGTDRRILAGRYGGQVVIAPDNGLLSLVHRELELEEIYSVENNHYFPGPISRTFHGRDIMAPVAAHLAAGVPLSQLGPQTSRIEVLQLPRPRPLDPIGLTGCVLYVDRFGNLVTNISADDLAGVYRHRPDVELFVGDAGVGPVRTTYGDVPDQTPVALIGSSRMIEVAVNRGRACDHFQKARDAEVKLRPGRHASKSLSA